jgi:hypothetical protein
MIVLRSFRRAVATPTFLDRGCPLGQTQAVATTQKPLPIPLIGGSFVTAYTNGAPAAHRTLSTSSLVAVI